MIRLVFASLIWAFSFGLIKRYLTGLRPEFVAAARLVLSTLIFLPWVQLPRTPKGRPDSRTLGHLLAIGAVEFGLMYLCYLASFQTLESWQVALFTSLTPIAVLGVASLYRREWQPLKFIPVLLASIATAALALRTFARSPALEGFLLVQVANLFFAWGQVHHVRTLRKLSDKTSAATIAFWEYLGGALVTSGVLLAHPEFLPASGALLWSPSGLTLLYSGFIASGLAFFLWNSGAATTAPATLSVLNNLKAPLAALVSLGIFREKAEPGPLLLSIFLFAGGFWLARRLERREAALLTLRPAENLQGANPLPQK